MARRKQAKEVLKDPLNVWEMRAVMLLGALEEIRKEAKQMSGGWRARVLEVTERHLGPDPQRVERGVCP